jgi:hypothetical protein
VQELQEELQRRSEREQACTAAACQDGKQGEDLGSQQLLLELRALRQRVHEVHCKIDLSIR